MSKVTIKGSVINASFPRSGHRFLKDHLVLILGSEYRYFDHYHDTDATGKNFAKTHDFELLGRNVLSQEFPNRRKYIVQVRHPLESIISYYEFKLHWNRIKVDTEQVFQRHLKKQLGKWKRFCDTWCLPPMDDRLIVTYQDLYTHPLKTLVEVCEFMGECRIDNDNFATAKVDFRRYYSDSEGQPRARSISDFRYFNEEKFELIEQEVLTDYLVPLGISPKIRKKYN
ncbi:sulfotransferase domain-containing protein [uncultured Umboniibacter sp.]|uniref:sulfotransferase domain-containing protein n=1 Tax=uncultured Umboniibacter sp. TaxID=1798917 RepID=UPI002607005B|nr:sulfotransferase domain-containing protein [uncultured Umboniibacter sp.]